MSSSQRALTLSTQVHLPWSYHYHVKEFQHNSEYTKTIKGPFAWLATRVIRLNWLNVVRIRTVPALCDMWVFTCYQYIHALFCPGTSRISVFSFECMYIWVHVYVFYFANPAPAFCFFALLFLWQKHIINLNTNLKEKKYISRMQECTLGKK